MQDTGIIRNRLKIQSVIENVLPICTYQRSHFLIFIWSYVDYNPLSSKQREKANAYRNPAKQGSSLKTGFLLSVQQYYLRICNLPVLFMTTKLVAFWLSSGGRDQNG